MIGGRNRGEISPESIVSIPDAITWSIDNGRDLQGRSVPVKHQCELAGIPEKAFRKIQSGFRALRAVETPRFCQGTGWTLVADLINRDMNRIGVPLPVVGVDGAMKDAAKLLREMAQFLDEIGTVTHTREHAARARREGEDVIAMVHAITLQIEANANGARR